MLVMQPTCEGRLPNLYVKPGSLKACGSFRACLNGQFDLITRQEVLKWVCSAAESHTPTCSIALATVAIPHGDAYLWWVNRQNVMLGRHGGLHPDEMLVPLYALSLD